MKDFNELVFKSVVLLRKNMNDANAKDLSEVISNVEKMEIEFNLKGVRKNEKI